MTATTAKTSANQTSFMVSWPATLDFGARDRNRTGTAVQGRRILRTAIAFATESTTGR